MSNKIALELIGAKHDDQNIRFSELVKEFYSINIIFNKIDKYISDSPKPTWYFKIANLHQYSPPVIELEALPLNPKEDHTVEVVDSFFDGLKTIVFEQFNEGTNRELIELFDGNLGKSLK